VDNSLNTCFYIFLHYGCNRGILHRDLKPDNILLKSKDNNTDIKLIDFGFAKVKDSVSATQMQTQLGTPKYVAPEILDRQVSGYYDGACPEKVDVWSAGVICYNMLSGQHPFSLKNEVILCRSIRRGLFNFNAEVWGSVDEKAKLFIRECLNIDPIERPSAEKAMNLPWLQK
jgi:calcium/calmodulin-dependent protein kinase I